MRACAKRFVEALECGGQRGTRIDIAGSAEALRHLLERYVLDPQPIVAIGEEGRQRTVQDILPEDRKRLLETRRGLGGCAPLFCFLRAARIRCLLLLLLARFPFLQALLAIGHLTLLGSAGNV